MIDRRLQRIQLIHHLCHHLKLGANVRCLLSPVPHHWVVQIRQHHKVHITLCFGGVYNLHLLGVALKTLLVARLLLVSRLVRSTITHEVSLTRILGLLLLRG